MLRIACKRRFSSRFMLMVCFAFVCAAPDPGAAQTSFDRIVVF